jgi:hypothetical protein
VKERVDIPNAPAMPAAIVQLAWHDAFANVWRPGPPLAGEAWPETGANGEFAAILRLTAQPAQDPDVSRGLLKARVQVTRGLETRATPEHFPFLPNAADAGRVPEGQLLSPDVTLGWMQLVAI